MRPMIDFLFRHLDGRRLPVGLSRVLVVVILAAATPASSATEAQRQAREAAGEFAKGGYERAIALFTAALDHKSLAKEERAIILNDRGLANWRRGRALVAIADFNQAIMLYPEFAATYNNRGNVLIAIGRPDEAIRDFNRASALSPGYAVPLVNRGNAQMALGRLDAAIKDFSAAIALAPGLAEAFNGRGKAQMRALRPFAALRDFSRAIGLDPKLAVAYENRAVANRELGKYSDAINDLTQAITFAPANAKLYLLRGRAYLDGKNLNSAIKDFEKIIQTSERDAAVALAYRGLALARAGAQEEAMADFAAAIERDPRNAAAYANRAKVHLARGEPELGLPDIERALSLRPKASEILLVSAQVLEALGRRDEAIEGFRTVISVDPNSEEAWRSLKLLTGVGRPKPVALPDGGFQKWKVFDKGNGRYFARNARFPRLEVPLEMVARGKPRIIAWDLKDRPYRGIGVLRYFAGSLADGKKRFDVEYGAIVDLFRGRVVSLEPVRVGNKAAGWTWENGSVSVAGPDGLVNEFVLRKPVAPRTAVRVRRPPGYERGDDFWGFGADTPRRGYRRPAPRPRPRRRPRRRSFFGIFFE